MMILRYFITFLFLGNSHNIFASEVGRISIPEKKITLVITTADDALKNLPLNKMVPLMIEVQKSPEADPALKTKLSGFDAQMPEHGHGMVVKPKITALTEEKWRIDGVKFHMIGAWEISVFLEHDGKDHRYTLKLNM
jgi:hypothetical protein